MKALRRRYGRSRIPKHYDLVSEAGAYDRFSFIARFVARATATKGGRSLVNGMQVRQLDGGWTYTVGGLQATAGPVDAAKLFDMIRRTDLNHYVRQAEDQRAYALEGA